MTYGALDLTSFTITILAIIMVLTLALSLILSQRDHSLAGIIIWFGSFGVLTVLMATWYTEVDWAGAGEPVGAIVGGLVLLALYAGVASASFDHR